MCSGCLVWCPFYLQRKNWAALVKFWLKHRFNATDFWSDIVILSLHLLNVDAILASWSASIPAGPLAARAPPQKINAFQNDYSHLVLTVRDQTWKAVKRPIGANHQYTWIHLSGTFDPIVQSDLHLLQNKYDLQKLADTFGPYERIPNCSVWVHDFPVGIARSLQQRPKVNAQFPDKLLFVQVDSVDSSTALHRTVSATLLSNWSLQGPVKRRTSTCSLEAKSTLGPEPWCSESW